MRTTWIVAALLFITSLISNSPAKAGGFIRVVNCGDAVNIKPCTFETLEQGRKITLLSSRTTNTCSAIADKLSKFKGGLDDSATVTLLDTGKCKELHQYWLGFLDKAVSEYKHVPLLPVHNKNVVNGVDTRLRTLNLRSQEDDKYFGHKLSDKPLLLKPATETSTPYLAHYVVRNPSRPNELVGPLFFYSRDGVNVGTIAKEAVITHFFKLNGRSYLVYEHICWAGCDNTYTNIAEQTDVGFAVVFKG